ncbi:MAG: LysR family transcriptional regulator [Gammaproteobacteria bacterium]|nr:LysR family transcriptional regulator [Gammaproteobacteria bacterium]MDH3432025.1 LysR family transcriptional regulator [Gammaproteobacteria bacterium]MDH3433655.1 LysR family transcriptional regulator [Gammaproteobacteria bacterium]
MDTIDGMRTFVAVISEGSFSGAAERLNMSPQLVSKYVGQLETRLGARLLNRSTRRLSITEAGQAYFDRCQYVLAEIDEMESAVGDAATAARGTLRINAPMTFGTLHLSRAIAEYQCGQPEVTVDLTLDDRVVDIVSEGYDIAIRIGQLQESSLVARKLAPVRLVVCGSADYLAERGVPVSPDDLHAHDCLRYTLSSDHSRWRFSDGGETHDVRVSGSFSANNGDVLRLAALAGTGLVLQPTFIVGDDIRSGRLQLVLEDYEIEPMGVYAVYAHRQYLSGKVRTFVEFLADYFGSPPYWECG